MTERAKAPHPDEVEVSLFGPGYGECAVAHVGWGEWIVLDSFLTSRREPVALHYFDDIGVDPARAVRLIVATHWHDDHMKGLGDLVSRCPEADFCCASALGSREFLSVAAALARTGFPDGGVREIHAALSRLGHTDSQPRWATASRRIHRSSACEVWSLSPDDEAYTSFLKSLAPEPGTGQRPRIDALTPNELSVVLLVRFDGGISCLFGADLERRGWTALLRDDARPRFRASVFKVPHHGSGNAHLQEAWDELLEREPFAILAPWRRGRGVLPKPEDAKRILAHTPKAYATTDPPAGPAPRNRWVKKRLKNLGARIAPESGSPGLIRLRRSLAGEDSWRVELFGSACHLGEFAA